MRLLIISDTHGDISKVCKVVNDIKDKDKLKDILDELSDLNNVEYILGHHPENIDDIDDTSKFLVVRKFDYMILN